MKTIKPILILLIIIVTFIIISKYFVENFVIYHDNVTNNNKSFYLTLYDNKYKPKYYINSIPKNDNDFKNKLNKIFNINNNIKTLINISENIKWSNWVTANSIHHNIYNKFNKYISNIIGFYNIKIIYSILKNIKINYNNKNNILFNIDLLLYDNTINSKHINILVYYNNDKFYIIYINVIGVITEFDIKNNTYLKDINIENSFNNISNITNNTKNSNINNSITCDNKDTITDEYVDTFVKNYLLNNIDSDIYNVNDLIDMKKNIKYKENEKLVRNHFMNKLFKQTIITPYNY
jgi:hypothetical protein